MDLRPCIIESLCCTAEFITTLSINETLAKLEKMKKKKKRRNTTIKVLYLLRATLVAPSFVLGIEGKVV